MDIETINTFGQWLKARRKNMDMTQEMLAIAVGCSLAAIKKFESGERRPSRQIAALLADKLAIAPADQDRFVAIARGENSLDRLPEPFGKPGQSVSIPATQDKPALKIQAGIPIPATPMVGREHD